MQVLGRKMGELGGRQGALGGRQGVLGSEQGVLGARQAELAARQGSLALQVRSRERRGLSTAGFGARAETDRPGDEGVLQTQSELGRRQSELGEQQSVLGAEQSRYGEEMSRLSAEVEKGMRKLARESIESGKRSSSRTKTPRTHLDVGAGVPNQIRVEQRLLRGCAPSTPCGPHPGPRMIPGGLPVALKIAQRTCG